MDAPLPGLVIALCLLGVSLLLVGAYVLGKDAGIRQERGNWTMFVLLWWVSEREKRRE